MREKTVGFAEMISGAAKTLFGSGLAIEEVIDLIPVKPLGEEEAVIRAMYKSKLTLLYEKLKI